MGKSKEHKKSKKSKKSKGDDEEASMDVSMDASTTSPKEDMSYDELLARVCKIAKPLASEKLTKKLHKAVERAHKAKKLARGVKEVGKCIRKGEKGLCIIAGNISPIDVIAHLPVVCEDADIPYCYVPSKENLGLASQTKRPTSVILIKNGDVKGLEEAISEVNALA